MEDLLKEKAEYARQGMKGDTKSMLSKMTGVSRMTDANNAYLYSLNDQQKIQDINDRLQKFNPGLVGSQIMSSDNFDTEASVISGGKNAKNKMREFDDQRSMMSNVSGMSRKSALSLLDIDSITSVGSSKKLPGERGLRQAAERRMQKAQMAKIESHLKKMQESDDLSYSHEESH